MRSQSIRKGCDGVCLGMGLEGCCRSSADQAAVSSSYLHVHVRAYVAAGWYRRVMVMLFEEAVGVVV